MIDAKLGASATGSCQLPAVSRSSGTGYTGDFHIDQEQAELETRFSAQLFTEWCP